MSGYLRVFWLCCLLLLSLPGLADNEPVAFERAVFLLDDGAQPPATDAPWQEVSLPDHWRISRPAATAETGWYRVEFTATRKGQGFRAVYLPKLVMNAEVFLNGERIGSGGSFAEPVARNWNRPLLFLFPHDALRDGNNVLHVRLRAHAYTQPALGVFFVGSESLLRERYERAYFLNITLNQTATLLIASVGLLMLSLWARRRQDTAYAYFGTSALVWAVQSTNLYIQVPPFPTAAWEIFSNAGFQVFAGFLLISLLRFVHCASRKLVAALWLAVCLAPLSMALVPAPHYLALTALWHLYTLACAIMTLALLLRAALAGGNREAGYLVSAMLLVIFFALHDWLIHSQHLWSGHNDWPLNDVFLLQYSAPMIFLALGLIMTGRFVRVLNEFEEINDQLEERVEAKQKELQASHARMHRLEMEQAVAEERERIYRDLHDDVGAKLLSLVYRAARSEDAELARSALQDLRDVVSRTGAGAFGLDEVLADWRVECEKRLSEGGLGLVWRLSGEIEGRVLSQPQALDLGRILREALSNAIRHAQASEVTVTLSCLPDALHLHISDNGRGLPASRRDGRGLHNMENRAARLGGCWRIGNQPGGGCLIEVEVPLAGGVPASD